MFQSNDDATPEELKPQSLELKAPPKAEAPREPWSVVAHNKRVLKNWETLVRDTEQNAINAYDWLIRDPMKRMPGRCYPLKYSKYAGHWCYEVGAGDRVYYRPDETTRKVTIWYAGPHPKRKIPDPPKG